MTIHEIYLREREKMFEYGTETTKFSYQEIKFWRALPTNIVTISTKEEIDILFCMMHWFSSINSQRYMKKLALLDLEEKGPFIVQYVGDIIMGWSSLEPEEGCLPVTQQKGIVHRFTSLWEALESGEIGAYALKQQIDVLQNPSDIGISESEWDAMDEVKLQPGSALVALESIEIKD